MSPDFPGSMRLNARHLLLLSAAATGLAVTAPSSALAQDAAAQDKAPITTTTTASPTNADKSAPAASDAIPDIVVTAERRTQRLQDVPISATVLSATDLSAKGVANVNDLQQVAPSVAINTYNRSTFINIRGVGIAISTTTSSPGVAYYIDGQVIPHEQFIGQSFYDIDSIEVLRGPQGTLSGQNSTGGAVYVRTPAPNFSSSSGYIDQTVGSFNHFKTVGAVNLGLNDNVAIRISGIHDQRDSFSRNAAANPRTPGNVNLDSGRINLALRSDDESLRVNVRGEYFNSKTDNIAVKNRADTFSTDPFMIEEDADSYLNTVGYRLSAEVRYAVTGAVEVRGLTALQHGTVSDLVDGDRTATAAPRPPAGNVGRVTKSTLGFETFINEINVLSTGSSQFQWVVGGFTLDENVPYQSLRDNNHTVDFVSATQVTDVNAHNTSRSIFGQGTYSITGKWQVLAGARYNWDEQFFSRYTVPGSIGPSQSDPKSTSVTGKVGINYHPSRDTLIYITAAKGYKAGGANLAADAPNFLPEKNYLYETGLKTNLFNKHLLINGSLFYTKYKDIQLSSLFNGQTQVQNAASGKSYGGELELTGRFAALSFNGGVGYLKATFARDVCLNDAQRPAGNRLACPSASPTLADSFVPEGSMLPFAPEWTINAGIQYRVSLGSASITPRLQWAHVDQQIATPFPGPTTIVPRRDVFDARITLDANAAWRFEGYVTNFTNRTYIASQVQSAGSADGGYIYGAPREFGVRAVYKFGS